MLAVLAAERMGGLAGFTTELMDRLGGAFGGPGAGIANALDSFLPFLPSEVILPLAGVSAGRGHMTVTEAVLWTTLGSVVGSLIMYGIGAALGRERVRALAVRVPLVKAEEVDRTEAWFARHGGKAVFFGRMVPVFRSFISLPAGIERMPLGRFVLYTAGGSVVWNALFVYAGYALGRNWQVVERYAGVATDAVVGAVVLAVLWFVLTRLRRARAQRRGAAAVASEAAGPSGPPADAERPVPSDAGDAPHA